MVCTILCLQRKGWSSRDRTGTEAQRDLGAVLAREPGSVGSQPHPRGLLLLLGVVLAMPGDWEQPCLGRHSHSSLPKSSSPISQSLSACPCSAPAACPRQGQAILAGKAPSIRPACTATLFSSPEPRSDLSNLFAAPSCGEGSGFCLAPSYPLCPASRGTSLSRARQAGGCCHVSRGRKAHVISALGRERLRERAGEASRAAAGNRPCWEAHVTARTGGKKGQGETGTCWKPALQGTRCPAQMGWQGCRREAALGQKSRRAPDAGRLRGACTLHRDPPPTVQLSGGGLLWMGAPDPQHSSHPAARLRLSTQEQQGGTGARAARCPGFGWDRVNSLLSSWYSAGFWI